MASTAPAPAEQAAELPEAADPEHPLQGGAHPRRPRDAGARAAGVLTARADPVIIRDVANPHPYPHPHPANVHSSSSDAWGEDRKDKAWVGWFGVD